MSDIFASTPRLNIRGYRESDLERILALWNHPVVQKTGPGYVVPNARKLKDVVPKRVDDCLLFVVFEAKPGEVPNPVGPELDLTLPKDGEKEKEKEKGEGEVDRWIGALELEAGGPKNRSAEFGIAMEPRWWGKGYGTEVLGWMLDHAFDELALHRVALGASASNPAALKLYRKLGFREEGRKLKAWWSGGQWTDTVSMAILEEEWLQRREQLADVKPEPEAKLEA